MQIYLPIAELPVDIFSILALGLGAGFLAGMFGIGGGFIMTPMLMFMGIPPAVAVATSANQIIASSVSGFTAHNRRKNVDFKMGNFLLIGGFLGSMLGTKVFSSLKNAGQIDVIISGFYVVFLGGIGALMAYESISSILRRSLGVPPRQKKERKWQDNFPWKVDFPHSDMTLSGILPIGIGFFSGILVALLGIGGGFLIIPAMIYILRMPSSLVIGTSLYQMITITAATSFFHAYYSQTVDVVLAVLLLVGSVVGAQYGTRVSYKLPAENMRGLLAVMILALSAKMAMNLLVTPVNPFTVTKI